MRNFRNNDNITHNVKRTSRELSLLLCAAMALTPEDVALPNEDVLPLKIHPKGENNSVEFLKRWITDNQEWLDQKLLEHGKHCLVSRATTEQIRLGDFLIISFGQYPWY